MDSKLQIAEGLFDGAELGVRCDLDNERLRVITPGAPREEQPVWELGRQNQLGRRRLPANQVGDAAEAENGVAMVLDEPLGALVLVLLPGRYGHGPPRSPIIVRSLVAAKSALTSPRRSS